jgi:hypothetical protein
MEIMKALKADNAFVLVNKVHLKIAEGRVGPY